MNLKFVHKLPSQVPFRLQSSAIFIEMLGRVENDEDPARSPRRLLIWFKSQFMRGQDFVATGSMNQVKFAS